MMNKEDDEEDDEEMMNLESYEWGKEWDWNERGKMRRKDDEEQ